MCSLLGASEGSNSAIVRDERAVDATHMGEDHDVSSPPKSGVLHNMQRMPRAGIGSLL